VDIYALGILGYELLTGTTPFEDRAPHQILAAHMTEDPEEITARRSDVPPPLADVVMRCLEKDIDKRWNTGDEVVHRLGALGTPGTVPASDPTKRHAKVWLTPVIAGLVASFFLWQWLGTSTDVPEGLSSSIAVFPFTYRGGPELEYWGEGMVRLLSTSLDGAGDLRKVDPIAVHGAVERADNGVLDPEAAGRIARDLGARWFVLGEILEVGAQLNVSATLYDVGRGGTPVGEATAAAEPDVSMVDGVATQLLASGGFPGSRVTTIAEVTTASMPALKAYLEGEKLFRAGEFRAAIEVLEEAVTIDSQFAAAYYRLSEAANWAVVPSVAEEAAAAAVRHASRLDHDRRMLGALGAFRSGAFEEAERTYREVAQTWPQDVEALVQLGEVQFHSGPLRGFPIANSRRAFERALEIDPDNMLSLIHLQRIAAGAGDGMATDTLGQRILALMPTGERSFEVELYRANGLQDSVVFDDLYNRLDELPDRDLPQTLAVLMYDDGFEEGERLLATHLRSDRAPAVRALGHAVRAHWLATHGRWERAWRELDVAETLDRALGLTHRTFFALHPIAAMGAIRSFATTCLALYPPAWERWSVPWQRRLRFVGRPTRRPCHMSRSMRSASRPVSHCSVETRAPPLRRSSVSLPLGTTSRRCTLP
jgi:tetratricopeptide (TPR) repeat protein